MTEPEQRHIVSAFVFELSKVATLAVRRACSATSTTSTPSSARASRPALGMEGQAETIKPARPIVDMKPSPALSLIAKAPKTLEGRKVGVLVTDGSDGALVAGAEGGGGEGRRAARRWWRRRSAAPS